MKRRLTSDEHSLWRRVTKDVAPLHPAKEIKTSGDQTTLSGSRKNARQRPASAPSVGVRSSATHAAPDVFHSGDPRLDRHVRRGRMDIDARFDLHGHSWATAKNALHDFVVEARRRGHRCVLVITGKGSGVLRSGLQAWLHEEALRQHIVRASPAHQKHGGGGAFYLFLKAR